MDWARLLAYITGTVDQEQESIQSYRETECRRTFPGWRRQSHENALDTLRDCEKA
jgi:hypothetical protein